MTDGSPPATTPGGSDASGSVPDRTGPFGRAAKLYWTNGWANPFPVVGKAGNVPTGITGYDGRTVSYPDLRAWLGQRGEDNIALRLTGVVGIDVDCWDGKTGDVSLAAAVAELGDLPPTWWSSSRDDGSRILFYRVPALCSLRGAQTRFRERFGEHVDILHRGHRYAVVWPSIHPDTGRLYGWFDTFGRRAPIEVPKVDDLPMLPECWLDFLAEPETPAGSSTRGSDQQPRSSAPAGANGNGSVPDAFAAAGDEHHGPIPIGRRHDELMRYCARLREYPITHTEYERLAFARWQDCEQPTDGAAGYLWTWQEARVNPVADVWRRYAGPAAAVTEPGSAEPGQQPTTLERLRGRLRNRAQLAGITPPVPLIEGVLDVGTMAVVAGKFGTFKTFAALSWACSVATGTPWLGHPVATPGVVVYVAAEGASGVQKRVTAWEVANAVVVPDDRLWVIDVPVNIGAQEQTAALGQILEELHPALVVFDTLHRNAAGLDENSPTEMGAATRMADAIRERWSATTLYVHHTGHAGERSRGASSIEDDADCVWVARLVGDESRDPSRPRLLEQRKTKDSPLLEPFHVRLEVNDEIGSGVLELVDESGQPMIGPAGVELFTTPAVAKVKFGEEGPTESATKVIGVFAEIFAEGNGGTKAEVKRVATDRYGMAPASFYRAWNRLEEIGALAKIRGTQRYKLISVEDRAIEEDL